MTPDELAAIVVRDDGATWMTGETLAALPAIAGIGYAMQAVSDRHALLVLLRETREALALRPSGHVGPERIPWFSHTNISHGEGAECLVCRLLARLASLGAEP